MKSGAKQLRERASILWHVDVCHNEDGVALILVMVMLVMLTFIGLAAMSTSSTELFLSANYRRTREAFQAADGMTEEALVDTTNFVVPLVAASPCSPGAPLKATIADVDPSNQGNVTASGCLIFTATGPAPAGAGMGQKVKANYFILDTTGTGSLGATSRQELVMSKIVPGG